MFRLSSGQHIEKFVGDGSQFGLSVTFSVDGEKLLGTGGAVKKALARLEDDFFVMYGDSYLTVNFKDVYDCFLTSPEDGINDGTQERTMPGIRAILFLKTGKSSSTIKRIK